MAQIGVDIGNYTFDASAKTITFSGVTIDTIEQIKPIVNGATGKVIFNPAQDGRFGSLVGNVLTLEYDTATDGSADTDPLYICVNIRGEGSKFGELPIVSTETLSDVSTVIVGANIYQKEVWIVNTTGKKIWLFYGPTAFFGRGIPLLKDEILIEDIYRGQISAIMDTGQTGDVEITVVRA